MTDKTLTPGETARLAGRVLAELERVVVGRRRNQGWCCWACSPPATC